MSSSSVLPSTPAPTSLSSPAATSSATTDSGQQLACHTIIYIVVIIVVVAIICGTIQLMWNDDWRMLSVQRSPMESERSASSSLVQWMLRYFFKTLVPAFRHTVRATANQPHQLPLPLFTSPWFQGPHLATPLPVVLHDLGSSRVPFYSYTDYLPQAFPFDPPFPAFPASARSPPLY